MNIPPPGDSYPFVLNIEIAVPPAFYVLPYASFSEHQLKRD